MSDSHLRILQALAKWRQRQLDNDGNTTDRAEGRADAGHRRDLQQAAGRADATLAAAEARRRAPSA